MPNNQSIETYETLNLHSTTLHHMTISVWLKTFCSGTHHSKKQQFMINDAIEDSLGWLSSPPHSPLLSLCPSLPAYSPTRTILLSSLLFLFSFVSSCVFFFSTFLFGTTIYSRSPSSVLQDTFLFPVVTSLLYFKLSSPTSLTCSLIFSKLSPNWYHSQEVSQVGRHNISAMAWWLPLLETEKAIFFSIATFFPDFLDFFHVP